VVFGGKKRSVLVDVFIVKHLIVRGYKDNKNWGESEIIEGKIIEGEF